MGSEDALYSHIEAQAGNHCRMELQHASEMDVTTGKDKERKEKEKQETKRKEKEKETIQRKKIIKKKEKKRR